MDDNTGDLEVDATAGPLWRRLEETIRREILDGTHAPGAQLPSDRQIATTHGASRMTARRALAALEQEGLIRIEHGSGTFVSEDALVRYRLGGERVRFGQDMIGLGESARLHRKVLGVFETTASGEIARRLGLKDGAPVLTIRLTTLSGETPVSAGWRHCDGRRFKGLAEAFEAAGSMTAALKRYGVEDYRRAATDITARPPTADEARILRQSKAQPVLAYAATDVETATGDVISYHLGAFASERVVISVGAGGSGQGS